MKRKNKYKIAIVGATGAVGREMVNVLAQRKFPVGTLRLFGSKRSKGKKIPFRGKEIEVEELQAGSGQFYDIDIVLSSAGGSVSRQFAPEAVKAGAVVIDNTSAFRMDPEVPLVIPEINPEDIQKHKGIIANPNCSAMIMLVAIAPLYRANRIRRILCATYQSVSGAGARAMTELIEQSKDVLANKPLKKAIFPHQIAFNLFSHNSAVTESGYNEEEVKMIQESKKILHDDSIRIAATCIRVPVLRAHSEALYLEFERPMPPEEAREILRTAPGVKVVDEPKSNYFPMPIEATGEDDVLVGRIRKDLSSENGLALFAAGDQLRKGAALNAVQIAEYLIRR